MLYFGGDGFRLSGSAGGTLAPPEEPSTPITREPDLVPPPIAPQRPSSPPDAFFDRPALPILVAALGPPLAAQPAPPDVVHSTSGSGSSCAGCASSTSAASAAALLDTLGSWPGAQPARSSQESAVGIPKPQIIFVIGAAVLLLLLLSD